MFQDDATQQPVGSNGRAAKISGAPSALGQRLGGQIQQTGILQDLLQRIQNIVGDGRDFFGESQIEQRSLAVGATDH